MNQTMRVKRKARVETSVCVACVGCGKCAKECPASVISIEEVTA